MPTMKEFRNHRGMPFVKQGMRVFSAHYKRHGRVASSNASGNLNIRFDNETRTVNCHPSWMIDYFDDDGNVVASYRD